ncbi:Kelch repeat and BTB domain-containing protein 7 [Lemmus lemmus]
MGSIREETLADLTLMQLLAVLSIDSLGIESEKTVCHVTLQWLEAAPEERGPRAAEVFKCIRWALFRAEDQNYLEGLLTRPMVEKYCLDIVAGTLLQLRFGDPFYKSVASQPNSSFIDSCKSSNSYSSSSSVVSVAENPPRRRPVSSPSHNRGLNCGSLKRNDFQEACIFKDEIYCICDTPVMKVYNPAGGKWRQIINIPLDAEIHNYQIVSYNQNLLLITVTIPQWKKNRVTVYEYDSRENQRTTIGTMLDLVKLFSDFICVSARVYPSYLEHGQNVITDEDDTASKSSTEWTFYEFSDSDSE